MRIEIPGRVGVIVAVVLSFLSAAGPVASQQCLVTTAIGPGDDLGTAVAVQADGKIVLSGFASNGTDDDIAVVRYNPDFTLDASFGTGGIVTTPIGSSHDRAEALAIQSDGKIVVAGHKNSGAGNNDFAVVRYNTDGSLDTTFNPGGGFGGAPNLAGMVVTAITAGDDEIEGVAIQSDGKIVVAGFSQRATLDYVAARYNSDGSLDTAGFNAPTGFYISTNGATNDVSNAVAVQPSDGKIVLSGWAHSGVNEDFAVVRLNTDGTFDSGFGTVLVNFPPNERERAHTVIVQPDGKILASGEVRSGGFGTFGAARLNADGTLDGTFGTSGVVTTSFSAAHDVPHGMVLQTDDHIVLGGYTNWTGSGTTVDWALLRYDDLGNLDGTFDTDGKLTMDIGGDNDWIDALALQPDGKIIAGGYSVTGGNDDFALARFNVDGTLDTSCVRSNYRSIGTNSGILANTGDASITAGTDVVTFGGGASLPAPTAVGAVGVGDQLILDPGPSQEVVYILSRDSDTQVTLQTGALATHTNVPYEIRRAYTTLQAWEDAHDGNLVGENRREIGVTYKDGPFIPPYATANAALRIDGSTTDADRFMRLTVARGQVHGGITGAGVVVDGQGTTKFGILDQDDYTRIEGLELARFKKAGDAGFASIVAEGVGAVYHKLLIHDFLEPTVSGDGVRVSTTVGGWSFTLRNSIIFNGDRTGVRVDEATSSITVENCTVYNMESWGVAVGAGGGTATVTNTLSMNHGTASFDAGSGTLTQSFNISSDATATGGGSLTNRIATDNAFPGLGDWVIFESLSAPEDLHLKNSAENDALDGANDLSPTFWRDVDTQSRFGVSWDYGADELVCQAYYTDEGSPHFIARVDLDGSRQTTLISIASAGDTPRGITLDVAGGKMYWAEGGTKIRRANLDGSNIEDLVTGLSTPRDIDLDVAAGKMYWTDSGSGRIQRANLDGTNVQNILGGLSTPRAGPALDLTAGKMYWTEDGSNKIRRANLDGSGLEDLVTTGLSGPFGIALDLGAGKMYWTDYLTDKIQRANLDGTGVEDLVTTGLNAPRGIALDLGAGKMYWVDYNTSKLSRANLDGTAVEDILTNLNSPNGVDIGCNIAPTLVPTAVELTSFTATASDGAVVLEWKTASEMRNLGFHLYRAESPEGPFARITAELIPGLGSSPAGAKYRHLDSGLVNGVTYYYELEDVETTGRTERYGPVSATPAAGASLAEDVGEDHDTASRITYGNPESKTLRVVHTKRGVILELDTSGFVAVPQEDGTVRLEVAGLEEYGSSLPAKRTWVDGLTGRNLEIVSVRPSEVEGFDGLRPAVAATSELVVSSEGTVRVRSRRRGRRRDGGEHARVVTVAYQGEQKKALVELTPFEWDGFRLWLARKLQVRLAFRGREPESKPRSRRARGVTAHLVAVERGLYAISLQELFGRRGQSSALRLSRQGRAVPYHLSGDTFYFWSEGEASNPYGSEAVYELELGVSGETMDVLDSATSPRGSFHWHDVEREEDRYYQATLVDAPDVWLWDVVFAPERKAFGFDVRHLASVSTSSRLSVWLQGTSDIPDVIDHHVRVYVNGSFVAETHWNGKDAHRLETEIGPGILRDGENALEIENVGDTGAAYSMIMLDRFRLDYPRQWSALDDVLHVIELGGEAPRWVTPEGLEHHGRYEGVRKVLRPTVRTPRANRLASTRNRADYLVIGPESFLEAAAPLLSYRRQQGLRVETASVEAIGSAFGYGELSPRAVRDFVAYAYHEWQQPSLRYVLLLGDATYDFKDALGTGVTNHVPPFMIRTSYLWTASDPAYAAVNGDDLLPDVAVGRLPARSIRELRIMVDKILELETGEPSGAAPYVLIADDADEAGDFARDADEIASTLLAARPTTKLYLDELGTATMRQSILESFDAGATLVSYLGHGAIHLWADENIFNARRVAALSPQSQQPLLLTMNCLNGYFHFPYFDSLAEALLKADGKGAIAAFSPSGLSLNEPAHRYHKALLRELSSGEHARLGDAVLEAQKRYADTGAFPELLAIYHLFGDPALTLRH